MPVKRARQRKRQRKDDEDEADEHELAITQAPSERRLAGVSAAVLEQGASLRPEVALGEPEQWGLTAGPKAHGDIAEQRMEEFLQSELRKAFKDEVGDDAHLKKSSELETAEERVPEHLNTQAIADVSVPGFNTAITEFKLAADADASVGQPGERNGAQAVTEASVHDKGNRVPLGSTSGSIAAPFVPRDMFPAAFGKQRKAPPTSMPDELRRK